MVADPKLAALALHRFGFGPRAGTIAAIAGDPRGALLAELDRPAGAHLANAALPTSGEAARDAFEFQFKQREARRAARAAATAAAPGGTPSPAPPQAQAARAPQPQAAPADPSQPRPVPLPQKLYRDDAKARLAAALHAETGFVERLTWFWSKSFLRVDRKAWCPADRRRLRA